MRQGPLRRTTRIVAGSGLILLGVPLLVLPGPGLLTIFAGISVVSNEFEWASKVVDWTKEKTARLRGEDERPSDDSSAD
jgi:uncharacterized protein (TIGR02611 family)